MRLTPTRIAKSATRTTVPALLAVLGLLAVGAYGVFGAPHAASPRGEKNSPGTSVSGNATQNANKKFTIRGDLVAPLTLGAPGRRVALTIDNPHAQTLVVSEIVVAVAGVSPSACAKSNFDVVQTAATVTLPGRSSRQLDAAAQPRVVWVNSPTVPQNHCLGADLTLSYTGKGTLR